MDLRTGIAYWPLRNGLLASYPSLDRDEVADVAIVGGGITGALAAYELTHAGADVIVFDKRDIAMGSSAATTGLLLYEVDTSLLELSAHVGERSAVRAYRLGLEAIGRIESMTVGIGDPCGFARRPSLYLASRDDDVPALVEEHALRRRHGFDVDLLNREAIERRWGIEAPTGLYSFGAEIDCYRLTHRLIAAAHARGARIYDRTAIRGVTRHAGGVTMSTVTGHAVRARWLVSATGYEAAEYLHPPATSLSSTWAFISEPLEMLPWPERSVIWETARPYLYLRTTDDNRLLAGGEDEPYATTHQDVSLLATKTDRLASRVRALFPALRFDVAYAWAGTFGSTIDGLPFIGSVPGDPRTWYALGYGGNGITFSVVAAQLLKDAYLGRRTPDAAIFSLDRPSARASASAARSPGYAQS